MGFWLYFESGHTISEPWCPHVTLVHSIVCTDGDMLEALGTGY